MRTEPAPSTGALAPLAHRDYRAMIAGRATSFLGNGMAPIALAFAVLDLTGSATDLGLVVGARSVASAAVMLFGGVLADRLPRPMLLQGSSHAAGAVQLLFGLSLLADFASLPLLVVMSVLGGALSAISMPTTTALIPQTVPRTLFRQANALLRMITSAATALGAAAGGLLIAWSGSGWGIVGDALSFVLAGVFFGRMRVPEPARTTVRQSLSADLRLGWTEFASHHWLLIVVAQATVWQAVWAGSIQVLGPTVADQHIGRSAWGVMVAAQTCGTIAGGLLALRWQPRRALAVGVLLTGVSAALPFALALAPLIALLVPVAFLVGTCMEQVGVAVSTAVQENIQADRLARVSACQILGSYAAIPLGQALAGPLAGGLGAGTVLTSAGLAIVLSMLASVASPSVRGLERASQPDGQSPR